jgi:SEC-C motif-containing protein
VALRDDCPCGTGRPYAACCEPFHRGLREAPDAEALLRSRYAAFARREVGYLRATLHPEHPDRALPEAAALAALREAAATHRYQGLVVLDRDGPDGGVARVLFHARVFHRGRDRSFVECSEFVNDGAGWRYLAGTTAPPGTFGAELAGLTIARFLARIG